MRFVQPAHMFKQTIYSVRLRVAQQSCPESKDFAEARVKDSSSLQSMVYLLP